MFIIKKKKKEVYPPLIMNGRPLEEVTSHKHLGITLSKSLIWDEHIIHVKT